MGKGGPLHGLGYMATTTRMQGAEHGPAITSNRGAGDAVRVQKLGCKEKGKGGHAHGLWSCVQRDAVGPGAGAGGLLSD